MALPNSAGYIPLLLIVVSGEHCAERSLLKVIAEISIIEQTNSFFMRNNFEARYYIFLICATLLGSISSINAQFLLKGKILEAGSNKPIPDCVIDLNESQIKSKISGEFEISFKKMDSKKYYINIFKEGYESITKSISENEINLYLEGKNQFIVYLNPSNKLLEQAIITGSRNTESITRSKVSTEVIKPYLIQNKGVTNMDKFLSQIPSVSVIDGQINIRSGSGWTYGAGSRVLVLVDDLPFLMGDAGNVKWGLVPIENVKQIEVIKGASSVLYGSGALNGIIHFRTEQSTGAPITRFNVFTSGFSKPKRSSLNWTNEPLVRYGFQGFHSRMIGTHKLTFSSNYLNDDGYRLGETEEKLRLAANYQNQKQNFIYGLGITGLLSKGSSFLLWESYQNGYTALDSEATASTSQSVFIDPFIKFNAGGIYHQFKARWMYVNNDLINTDPNVNQDNSFKNFYSEYQFDKVYKKTRATGGLVWGKNNSDAALYGGQNTNENRAAFLQLDQQFKKLSFTLGARYEWFKMNDESESGPVFRTAINYKAGKAGFLRASWGQGYRYPSIAERFITTSVGALNIFPNPKLGSEKGWSAELGFKQGYKLKGLSGFVDIALFYTKYTNMIEFNFGAWKTPNPMNPFSTIGFKSFNIGETEIKGIDFSSGFEGKFAGILWQGMLGYTYTIPVILDENYVFALDSLRGPQNFRNTSSDSLNILKYRFEHQIKIDLQASYKRFELGISWRYNSQIRNVDRAFIDGIIAKFVPGIQEARNELRGNNIVDFRASFKINKNLKIALIINNLLNSETMFRPADLGPPRMTMLQLSGRF